MSLRKMRTGNQEYGLLIYEEVSDSFVEKKYLKYTQDDLNRYQEKFEVLRDDGIIYSTSEFLDHTWRVMGREYYKPIDFTEVEYNKELYLSLKCFIVVQLHDRRLAPDTVHETLKSILSVVEITSAYDKRNLIVFEEWKLEKMLSSKFGLERYKNSNLGFLYFNPINDASDYISSLEDTPGISNDRVREIPTYEEFVRFDSIIHDFMNTPTTTPYMRSKYYPIFIWWRLSAIIPIRPLELVEIKNKDIQYDEEEKYYVVIGRRKQQPKPKAKRKKQFPVPHRLQINKEIYEIIEDYRITTNKKNEEYLFPMSHHFEHLTSPQHSNFLNTGKTVIHTNHLTWAQMYKLLDLFFSEVIQDTLGINVVESREKLDLENPHKTITQFNLMDTRHFSICTMMMQGFSELTIAQMAGHTRIETQSSYASHIDDFERSYSGLLAREIKGKMTNLKFSGFDHFTFRQKQLLSFLKDDYSKERKVDYGYCQSPIFPYECVEKDCIFCNKNHIDLSELTPKEQTEMANKITKIQDEIQVKLNFIKRYYQGAYKKKESESENNEKLSKELEQNSANLMILLNKKAMLEAHTAKAKEVEKE